MTRARRQDSGTHWGDVLVILTDDERIADVKDHVFSRAEVTDVIALRYDPIPGIDTHTTAEIFVNVQRAMQCKLKRRGWSPSKELALYIAHGCDHLTGGVDDTEPERNRMRRRELGWLRQAQAFGVLELLDV